MSSAALAALAAQALDQVEAEHAAECDEWGDSSLISGSDESGLWWRASLIAGVDIYDPYGVGIQSGYALAAGYVLNRSETSGEWRVEGSLTDLQACGDYLDWSET